jgi:hypothetical protein
MANKHRTQKHRTKKHRTKKHRTKKQRTKKHIKKKSNKITKFKELNCSPKKNHSFTCYSSHSLNKLKLLWNKRYPDRQITTNNSKEIWEQLKKYLANSCNTERCWLQQNFAIDNLDTELKNYTFAPKSPPSWKKNPNEWLDSNDINRVMRQYEQTYPNFNFIGPSPIDFNKKKLFGQCVWNDLCNFDLESQIKQGKNKIGIIFNTDPHHLNGSHWICLFINIKENLIYYFDSVAERIPTQVKKFIKMVQKQGKSLNIDLKYERNKVEHQKSDTECGMYVLFVITQLLQNKMTLDMFNERIPDKEMEKLRKILFN